MAIIEDADEAQSGGTHPGPSHLGAVAGSELSWIEGT